MPESVKPKEQWPDHGPTYRDWVDYVIRNSSNATQVLTPGGWSEWDAGRYAKQQYEDMQRDKAATSEMLKKALLRCDELATRLATATELLRELEYVSRRFDQDEQQELSVCPICDGARPGHHNCRLAAFLEGCKNDNPEAKA